MAEEKKVYGLIIPKKGDKNKKNASTTFNVFGNDEDSEEEQKTKGPVGPYGFTQTKSKLKLQSQMDIEKAMQDDPTVYEYDEIYDDIQATKPQVGKTEEAKSKKKQKPQYIAGLLKAAEVKKKENERRNERKVQKERDEEGEKYADKESFVTSAYKQKMLDMQKEAEEERRKEAMEEMTDVTKQKDLGGFYRYLYHQQTGTETEEIRIKEEPKEEVPVKKEPTDHIKKEVRQRSSSASDSEIKQPTSQFKARNSQDNTRKFRKRQADSSSESEEEDTNIQKRHSKKDLRKTSDEIDERKKSQNSVRSRDSGRDRGKERKRRHSSSSSSKSRSPVDKERKRKSESQQETRSLQKDKIRNDSDRNKENEIRSNMDDEENEHKSKNTDKSEINDRKSPPSNIHENKPKPKSSPIDPKDKVYPHHNSPSDIEAARKRYLIRKIEREKNRGL